MKIKWHHSKAGRPTLRFKSDDGAVSGHIYRTAFNSFYCVLFKGLIAGNTHLHFTSFELAVKQARAWSNRVMEP